MSKKKPGKLEGHAGSSRPLEGAVGDRKRPGRVGSAPDPELVERPRRRTFTAAYKLAIVREADACTETGEVGALLRREGLYSSHLVDWRRQRRRGSGGPFEASGSPEHESFEGRDRASAPAC